MTQNLLLDHFRHTVVPPTLLAQDRAFIAGGYVVDPHQAGDIDLWLLTAGTLVTTRRILEHLDEMQAEFRLDQINVFYTEEEQGYTDGGGRLAMAGVKLLAELKIFGQPKSIQVLEMPRASVVDALLESFDITTHQWALNVRSGEVARTARATLPSQLPRVTKWDTPANTYSRLRRICGRYEWDWKLHPDRSVLEPIVYPEPQRATGTTDDTPF